MGPVGPVGPSIRFALLPSGPMDGDLISETNVALVIAIVAFVVAIVVVWLLLRGTRAKRDDS